MGGGKGVQRPKGSGEGTVADREEEGETDPVSKVNSKCTCVCFGGGTNTVNAGHCGRYLFSVTVTAGTIRVVAETLSLATWRLVFQPPAADGDIVVYLAGAVRDGDRWLESNVG